MAGGSNTTVALLLAGAGVVAVTVGITDPDGGLAGAISSVLNGRPVSSSATPASASSVARFASALFSGSGASGSTQDAVAGTGSSGSLAGAQAVLSLSAQYLGTAYHYGGADPSTGFDCSGLVQYVYAQAAGIRLPRTAAAQAITSQGHTVLMADALPGDVLYWGVPAYHCGIYLGAGRVRDAPKTGDVVKDQALWSPALITVRRFLGAGAASSSSSSQGGLIST